MQGHCTIKTGKKRLFSPEWVLDCDVAVHSNSQQTKNGALGENEDEASNEQAPMEFSTETHTAVDKER